jgi:hypothetical protein
MVLHARCETANEIKIHNSVVRWLDAPEDHDYPAAASYLSLLATPGEIEVVIAALKRHQRLPSKPRTCCALPACRCWPPTTPT